MRPTNFFSLTDMSADFHNAMDEVTRRAKNKKRTFYLFQKRVKKIYNLIVSKELSCLFAQLISKDK